MGALQSTIRLKIELLFDLSFPVSTMACNLTVVGIFRSVFRVHTPEVNSFLL